jgi:hypothetical protein
MGGVVAQANSAFLFARHFEQNIPPLRSHLTLFLSALVYVRFFTIFIQVNFF